jgi:nitrogen fixation NifU-like protein
MIDDLRELYQEVILDHGKNPRNFRRPEDANRQARGDNPLCGDRMTVYLTIDGDEVIQDAAFEGRGCAISTASASMMTDMVRGKTVATAKALFQTFHTMCTEEAAVAVEDRFADDMDKLQVLSGVRQYPMRVKCATLAWHAMNAAMSGNEEVSTE